jgi:hypothetical protein
METGIASWLMEGVCEFISLGESGAVLRISIRLFSEINMYGGLLFVRVSRNVPSQVMIPQYLRWGLNP